MDRLEVDRTKAITKNVNRAKNQGYFTGHFLSLDLRTHHLDYADKLNGGVISDRLVATSEGFEIRQTIYISSHDGAEYRYLTNGFNLPAWSIVLLYKHCWNIEKVFDELKTKCGEQRSWASSLWII